MPNSILDQRWPWLVAAGLILLAFLSTVIRFGPETWDTRPVGTEQDIAQLAERDDVNVLFILIDTLRADRLSAYGYDRPTSPALDALASKGVRFGRHLSQSSWTKCSMASMWTAMYPARSGITRFDDVIPEEAELPAEVLKKAGFQTVAIYRNGWVAPTFGFQQGFDTYAKPTSTPLPPEVRRENPTLKNVGTDESATSSALEFLKVRGHKRWFLYLHLMDIHEYVYDEESAFPGGSYSDVYDSSIRWMDRTLEDFFRALAERGLLDKTMIVIASDHGEAFRERGLEGHARFVFRETTEVPLIVSFPFQLEKGAVLQTRTQNVDIWPTLFDLLGLHWDTPTQDGRSVYSEVLAAAAGRSSDDPSDVVAIAHLDQNWAKRDVDPLPTVAVLDGGFRYVRSRQFGGTRENLFDAGLDPLEQTDHAEEDPETLARLRETADRYLESESAWGEAPTREMDELELNQLRALGYAIPK